MKPEPMNPAARSVLDAYRERSDFSPQREDAAWEQLQARLDVGEAPRFDDAVVEDSPPRRRWVGWVPAAAVTAAAAALVIGVVQWGSVGFADPPDDPAASQAAFEAPDARTRRAHEVRTDRPPSKGVPSPRPPVAPEEPELLEDESADADVDTPPLAERPKPKPRPRSADRPATSPTTASIAHELDLLRKAQHALGRDDPQRALGHLQAHARQFPRGSLEPERLGLRAIALCRLDRPDGPKRAREFLSAHPDSTLRQRVQTTCVKKSGTTSTAPSRIGTSPDK